MAGAAGFEPTHARIKTWCLTAWRRPCIVQPNARHSLPAPFARACGATSRRCDPGPRILAYGLEVGGRLYQPRPCLESSQTHKLQCRSFLLERNYSTSSKRYVQLDNAFRLPAGSRYDHPLQEGCEL